MVVDDELTDDTQRIDRLIHALADATRRDIVAQTLAGGRSVSELARLYPMSFAAVQKHVAVLADAGLVSKHRLGREQLVRARWAACATCTACSTIWRQPGATASTASAPCSLRSLRGQTPRHQPKPDPGGSSHDLQCHRQGPDDRHDAYHRRVRRARKRVWESLRHLLTRAAGGKPFDRRGLHDQSSRRARHSVATI